MAVIVERPRPNKILARIILSQDKPFTVEEIFAELKKEHMDIDIDEHTLKETLNRLRDNRIVVQDGLFYSLYLKDIRE